MPKLILLIWEEEKPYYFNKGEYEDGDNDEDKEKKKKSKNQLIHLFNGLEACRRKKVPLMFEEKQNPNGSGIMLDFDLKLVSSARGQITPSMKHVLCRKIISIINKHFDLSDYINNRKPIYVGITSSQQNNNFHILIPGIFITRICKEYLVDKIINSSIFNESFIGIEFENGRERDALDKNCCRVPVFFYW